MKTSSRRIALLGVVAVVLALVAVVATPALAYYNYGTVGVSVGNSSLTVQAGQTVQMSVALNPASDSQTLGCGMAQCPQVCDSDAVVSQGYSCFDSNGNCTCAGSAYSTYYTEVSASSSNSGVASAYVSGNTLVVTGVSAGTATVTLDASLRQWSDGQAYVTVTVTSAPETSTDSGSSAASGSTTTTPPASTGTSSVSGASSAASSVQESLSSAGIPQEAKATDSVDDALNETVVDTVAGKIYTIEINDYIDVESALTKLVGTEDEAIFWSGDNSTAPAYSWTFRGADLSADKVAAFDPRVTVSELGTGDVANIMKQAKDGIVLEFAHSGDLPCAATLYVKADGYSDGDTLALFTYDSDTRAFTKVDDGLEVAGGYVSFRIDHCSVWALSSNDLSAYAVQEANTPGAQQASTESVADDTSDAEATGSSSNMAPAIVAVAAVAAAVVAIVYKRRPIKTKSQPSEENSEVASSENSDTEPETEGYADDASDK